MFYKITIPRIKNKRDIIRTYPCWISYDGQRPVIVCRCGQKLMLNKQHQIYGNRIDQFYHPDCDWTIELVLEDYDGSQ